MSQLKKPLDKESKMILQEAVKEFLGDEIMDAVWNNFFYWTGLFESLDGWTLGDTGASTGVAGTGVTLQTGASSNDITEIIKKPDFQNILTFDSRSRFKTTFRLSAGADSATEFNATIGQGAVAATTPHYGFIIDDGALKGSVADGTTQATVDLLSVSALDRHLIEARLLPGDKVVFLVSDADDRKLVERGTLTTNLPTGKINFSTNNFWIHYNIKTTEEAAKVIQFDFIEYLQTRIRF